ncbi:SufE family protein [Rhabdaerophilum calidifontis]|uniref:SufE family protein n=1 Tax=Rhabdaerophilum calidifontis TaxID=2604328 RepID=UPI001239B69D|nr:SufE family protein [Rhabdaerophilum calidifontis]
MPANAALQAIRDDLAFLDDWEDRYAYLIDLGRRLAPLPADAYTEANRVQGCASQVWLLMRPGPDGSTLRIAGDSDAMIVKGLVALVLAMFDDRPFDEIIALDAQAVFAEIGLKDHLTAQRSNGLASMVARIKAEAAARAG